RALTATEISNQFSVEKSISAQTDWVFSMPTTRYSVGMDYTTRQPTYSAVPPAGEGPQHVHSQNTTVQNGRVCFGYQLIYDYTRAGKQGQGDVGDPKFCGAATVVPIHQRDLTTTFTPSMLSASVALWPRELPNFLET
ncbi:surface layer protein NpdA, partial [Paracidovorax cattleyae]